MASFGSFSGQVERLRSLSTSGIGCHWSNKKQAACKLGLFLEEEAFCPGPETTPWRRKSFGPGKVAGCYWTMPSGAVVFQSPRVKSGNTWGMPPWATGVFGKFGDGGPEGTFINVLVHRFAIAEAFDDAEEHHEVHAAVAAHLRPAGPILFQSG